jgi:hypothetical protein
MSHSRLIFASCSIGGNCPCAQGAQLLRQQLLSQCPPGDYRAGYHNEYSERRNVITGHVILPDCQAS